MINLLSTKRLNDIRTAKSNTILSRYIKLIIFSALILVAIVLGAYYFLSIQHDRASEAKQIDEKQVGELEPYHEKAKQLASTVSTIANVMSTDVEFSSMLTQIGELMPTGAALTGLQLSTEDLSAPLIVSAHIDNEQRSVVLLNNLNQSDLFDRAQIRNIQLLEAENESSKQYNYLVTLDVFMAERSEDKK